MWCAKSWQTYVYFFAYLLTALLQTASHLCSVLVRSFYVYVRISTEALIAGFYVRNVLELYTIVLRDLTGLAALSGRYIRITLHGGDPGVCYALDF
jgi:hypothetical protein